MIIKAVEKPIEDDETGAVAAYHVVEYVSTDYKYQSVTATLNGYVSEKAFKESKRPISSYSLTINGLPENGEPDRQWIYQKAVEQSDETGSIFASGTLVQE